MNHVSKSRVWQWVVMGTALCLTGLGFLFYREADGVIRQVSITVAGLAIFAALAIWVRWERLLCLAPWIVGGTFLTSVGVLLFLSEGWYCDVCWGGILITTPLIAAGLKNEYRFPTTIFVVALLGLGIIMANIWTLRIPANRERLAAFVRGEPLESNASLVVEQSRWQKAMQDSVWFGSSNAAPQHTNNAAWSAARLADTTQHHGKWYPAALCAIFGVLAIVMVSPLCKKGRDCSARLFGILSALLLVAPIAFTILQALVMIPPVPNLPIPFVNGGIATLLAWATLGMYWASRSGGKYLCKIRAPQNSKD